VGTEAHRGRSRRKRPNRCGWRDLEHDQGEFREMTDKKAKPDIEELFADGRDIDAALREAVQVALLQTKRAGNPIATWKNGKVVWIAPEDIPGDDPRESPRRKRAQRGKRPQSKTRAKPKK